MNPFTLLSLIGDPRFLTGAGAGLVGAVVVLLSRRRLDWFLVWSVAAAVALVATNTRHWPSEAAPWMLGVAVATVVAVAATAPVLLRHTDAWVPHALFGLSVLGVWGTVPDTEHARVLLGAAATLFVVASGPRAARSSVWGLAVASALLAYVVMVDGWPRDSAVIGACGAVAMLVGAPAALAFGPASARLRRTSARAGATLEAWPLVGAQILLVILSGRLAGRAESAIVALGLLLLSGVGVALLWLRVMRWRQQRK